MNEREQHHLQVKSKLNNEKYVNRSVGARVKLMVMGGLPSGAEWNGNTMMICVYVGPNRQRHVCFSSVIAMTR